jgi:hypothetical protein
MRIVWSPEAIEDLSRPVAPIVQTGTKTSGSHGVGGAMKKLTAWIEFFEQSPWLTMIVLALRPTYWNSVRARLDGHHLSLVAWF